MQCPIDGTELKITDRQGIEIDYCPQCRGIWLDRGELDKLIERSLPEATPSQPRYDTRDNDDDDHRYDKRKRKSSFLGDLFDF